MGSRVSPPRALDHTRQGARSVATRRSAFLGTFGPTSLGGRPLSPQPVQLGLRDGGALLDARRTGMAQLGLTKISEISEQCLWRGNRPNQAIAEENTTHLKARSA